MTGHKWMALAGVAAMTAACAHGRYGPNPSTKVPEGIRTLKNISVNERAATLQRARVWEPIDTRSLNLAAGPQLPVAERIGEATTCRFAFPDKPLSGNTPKFHCEVRPDDVVKVKYGKKNGEVYAEIAASRLFWALGFKADRMYPTRVSCEGCPADPFAASKADWHAGKPGQVGPYVFDPAAIERPLPGSAIETDGYEGWAWPELDTVNPRGGGASRAQLDALKLLAVFVQHSDTKPEQQQLVCAPDGVKRDRGGNETCTSPWLVVKDLGVTFGKATALNNSAMDLDDWSGARIWHEGAPCVGDLSRSLTGSLDNPKIGEAGRQFLATRLLLLSDAQIRDLFTAARAQLRDETIADWVRVFKRKRTEIVDARCAA